MSAPRLLAITPPASAGPPDLACLDLWWEAGLTPTQVAILLRDPGRKARAFLEPDSPYRTLVERAEALEVELVVSVTPAERVTAETLDLGVHLRGTPTPDPADASHAPPGRSAHLPDLDLPHRCALPTRYWTFAPVFVPSSPGKEAVGLESLARACDRLKAPVLALGGVHAEQAEACLGAGAHGLAGISSFFGERTQVQRDTRAFARALRRHNAR